MFFIEHDKHRTSFPQKRESRAATLIIFCILLASALPAFAQSPDPFLAVSPIGGLSTAANFQVFATNILLGVAYLIPVLALAVVIAGGIYYIISLGDEKKTAKAKAIILYAIVGLIIIGLSVLIVNLIISVI